MMVSSDEICFEKQIYFSGQMLRYIDNHVVEHGHDFK